MPEPLFLNKAAGLRLFLENTSGGCFCKCDNFQGNHRNLSCCKFAEYTVILLVDKSDSNYICTLSDAWIVIPLYIEEIPLPVVAFNNKKLFIESKLLFLNNP